MSRPSLVARLQGAVIAHTLASLVDCPHTAAGLARWCIGWRRHHHPTGPQPGDWLLMWEGYLRGRPLVGWYQAELVSDFPALREVLDNPLWLVLRTLWERHHPTTTLEFQLQVTRGGQPCMFPMNEGAAMRRLCGCPDWRDLGIVLAILGAGSVRWSSYGRWLCKHVMTYLELVCLAEPGCFVRERLYELLDALYRRHSFGEIERWPDSFSGFEQRCQAWVRVAERIGLQPSAHGWDLRSLALLGLLGWEQSRERCKGSGQSNDLELVEPTSQQHKQARAVVRQHQADRYKFVVPQRCDDSRAPAT